MSIDYQAIVLNSTFTGIGTALGLSVYELFLKDKIHRLGERIKKPISVLDIGKIGQKELTIL